MKEHIVDVQPDRDKLSGKKRKHDFARLKREKY